MRKYVLLIFVVLLSSCSISKKTFEKEKTDETVDRSVSVVQTEITKSDVETSVTELSTSEIQSILQKLNFAYTGETSDDTAEIIVSKTESELKIKVSGKAFADYSEYSEIITQIDQREAETHTTSTSNVESNSVSKEASKTSKKTVSERKDKQKFDFSIWIYVLIAIVVLIIIKFFLKKIK